jgi:hypothetical protein
MYMYMHDICVWLWLLLGSLKQCSVVASPGFVDW